MSEVKLYLGDCLEILPTLPGPVDAIITDLPYGTTACSWDVIIPFAPMWEQVKRLLKPNGAFVTTASQPFTSMLVMSNFEWFKYEWIWNKTLLSGFLHAKNAPLKAHENVLVFSPGLVAHANQTDNRMNYYPQMRRGKPYTKLQNPDVRFKWGNIARPSTNHVCTAWNNGTRYPTSVLDYPNPNNDNEHPTQKPIALYEYLILTYTNPGDTVLDFCMGSGTTGEAAIRTGRNFIGCEIKPEYYAVAERHIHDALLQMPMPLVCQ